MKRRTAGLAVLLLIPVLALIGWYVDEQLPLWRVPGWIQPSNPDAVLGACEALATMHTYGATFANDSTAISADDARAKANAAVSQQTELPAGNYVDPRGPVLVGAAFPQIGPRLAWLNVAVLDDPKTDPNAQLGKVAIVYIDAETGETLAFSTSAGVDNPLTECGGGPVSRRELVRKYLPLIVLAGYVGLISVVLLVRYFHHASRLSKTSS